ncbi:SgcJ/EcaC family oxidoreductase [Nocardia otitidiscaviarum]|uniref:SgcJ/EcaC family oxidoreductase n=1 Tax=Nocardia otitidiscaviarum TaxID=1823 RepID=A0A516NHI0_9NOCA|nr:MULTISPECIES: SgcJ/EcaC family oxidoreductase [Nocardia]MBF6132378.1 SgcJ/EcaC family oxidoreductase [Nocardia otitidiscaviarum]MBF6177554.1 SgcJ/EcaC family oxidoreductase [Nocardia otitidiscaviarum]MBF6483470.1 SgcJ/EcaC family oxidoreductase [Nocardia otitidiscaviarum]MCP9620140.1 SgcJ/EcaC family oxidoreductase [Nocardia otitidiscaviarum]QDP78363.1 SgcJ/EcaC family oxidoreductase [Nocardia otitidiscaviarum]
MTTPDIDTAAELEAIHAVVAAVDRAQRAEDADAFLALFHPDAIWTTGAGRFLDGRDEIAEFTRAVLPGATKDGYATYEVFFVRFIRPDVAAVKVRQRYLSHDGEVQSEGSPLYGMTKEDGRWLLTFCQNTPVVDH